MFWFSKGQILETIDWWTIFSSLENALKITQKAIEVPQKMHWSLGTTNSLPRGIQTNLLSFASQIKRSEKSVMVSVPWSLHINPTPCFVSALTLYHNNLNKVFSVRIVGTSVRPSQFRDGPLNPKQRPNKRCRDLQFFPISEAMAANHSGALTLWYVKNSTWYSSWEPNQAVEAN